MKSFDDAKSKTLEWEQSGKLASRLVDDGEVAATLTWARGWGSLAIGKSGDSERTFERLGFLRPRETVREAGSEPNLAVLSINWAGEVAVVFSDGETFQFKRSGFRHPEWAMLDSRGVGVFLPRPDSSWRKKADVEIRGALVPSRRTPLLAILGWYVIILASDYDYDGGGSVAAVMAASGM